MRECFKDNTFAKAPVKTGEKSPTHRITCCRPPAARTFPIEDWGNITRKLKYSYTTGVVNSALGTVAASYGYTNTQWGDMLTSYTTLSIQSISYDAMGNQTSYLGKTLSWEGKQLTGADAGDPLQISNHMLMTAQ